MVVISKRVAQYLNSSNWRNVSPRHMGNHLLTGYVCGRNAREEKQQQPPLHRWTDLENKYRQRRRRRPPISRPRHRCPRLFRPRSFPHLPTGIELLGRGERIVTGRGKEPVKREGESRSVGRPNEFIRHCCPPPPFIGRDLHVQLHCVELYSTFHSRSKFYDCKRKRRNSLQCANAVRVSAVQRVERLLTLQAVAMPNGLASQRDGNQPRPSAKRDWNQSRGSA